MLESFSKIKKRILLASTMKYIDSFKNHPKNRDLLILSMLFFLSAPAWCQADNAAYPESYRQPSSPAIAMTQTPIHHFVILYDENVSFDHYFGTYPHAANPAGSPRFEAAHHTPPVNGIDSITYAQRIAPFRIDRKNAVTADQSHQYRAEQLAYHQGRMDRFIEATGQGAVDGEGDLASAKTVMGYFDGNTVTALWNYAQHFTLSDATYTDTFGPSTPGVLELVAGQTHGAQLIAPIPSTPGSMLPDQRGGYTLTGDLDPDDVCSSHQQPHIRMTSANIGDKLNQYGITWGNFMGGFDLTRTNTNGTSGCQRSNLTKPGHFVRDYSPHHNGFQYFVSTANPDHRRPQSLQSIGQSFLPDGKTPEPANHQYDLEDFFSAVSAGHFPAVSILKAPSYQDGHAGYSNPLNEQRFLVRVMNFLQQQPDWKNTAVIITYDDSDGWFDHASIPIQHASADPDADQLSAPGQCGIGPRPAGIDGLPVNGRCGPGPRIPLLILSPWVKSNWVDHTPLTQTSLLRFIEDNWLRGERLGQGSFDAQATSLNTLFDFTLTTPNQPLLLDENTGQLTQERP